MQKTLDDEVARYREMAREIRELAAGRAAEPEIAARMISISVQYERHADLLEEINHRLESE